MKTREGFVSNSSATSFIIKSRSNTKKTLLDFATENIHLLHAFNAEYGYDFTEKEFLRSAANDYPDIEWRAYQEHECVFGDTQDTVVGLVFDYILRDGGRSENFKWRFHEYHR